MLNKLFYTPVLQCMIALKGFNLFFHNLKKIKFVYKLKTNTSIYTIVIYSVLQETSVYIKYLHALQ